ncbi:MAG: hypothetical protein DYH02_10540 [Candidatus Omnitrophica bacterium COP1]|nr:hypothetical protein [Candidatus Omnitrophica bacterium COP1]
MDEYLDRAIPLHLPGREFVDSVKSIRYSPGNQDETRDIHSYWRFDIRAPQPTRADDGSPRPWLSIFR